MNVQDECIKIHSKFGMSEMANYKIQLLFDSEIEKVKKEYEEKLRWTPVEENLPPLKTWVICKHEEIYDTYFFDNEFQMAGCIKRFLITEWRFFL